MLVLSHWTDAVDRTQTVPSLFASYAARLVTADVQYCSPATLSRTAVCQSGVLGAPWQLEA
jgi:hypothetical protein